MNAGFEYLRRHVYTGLTNANEENKTSTTYCFTEAEFEIVLQRVQQLGLGIRRIAIWSNDQLFKAVSPDDNVKHNDPHWYFNAFEYFQSLGLGLQYSASFEIPYELIMCDFN